MQNLGLIADELMKGGLAADTPVAAIGSATMADQKIVLSTLGRAAADLAASDIPTPVIFVVGDIVTVREQLLDAAPGRA
jgi:siroheme synthase